MDFRGLFPPMITPFRDGRVDAGSIERLVEACAPHLDGMVVAGSTGEGPSMAFAERAATIEHFARAMRGRLRLIVGVAETSLDAIRELMRFGDEHGAVGYLVPLPFYFRHTPQTIAGFFREVSGYTDREIIVYDNPYMTKTVFTPADYGMMAGLGPNIRHVKITDTTLGKVDAAKERGELILLSGSDEVMQQQIVRGCEGAITAVPQVFPAAARAWFAATRAGDLAASSRQFARLLPLINEMMIGTDEYPAVVKFALRRRGIIATDEVRPPLPALSAVRRRVLDSIMPMLEELS
jgi:4-hydroxy-tetrahydrodipicolinate synthase